jgi:hypothetical protein
MVQTSNFLILEKADEGKGAGRLRIYIITMF